MVQVTCEKTGVVFEASSRRTKNHPQIMGWLSEASKDGWYGQAMEALKAGRDQHFTTIEGFVVLLQDACDKKMGTGKYDFSAYRSAHLPEIQEAIQAYLASYDEGQPVEEGMQSLSPISLLSRRLAKHCIWPLVKQYDAPTDLQMRLVNEACGAIIDPLRKAEDARLAEIKRQHIASLQERPITREEEYTCGAPYAGDYSYFLPEQQILICSFSEFHRAPTDYLQEEDSTYCRFVEPTEEEKRSVGYKQCVQWMQDALKKQEDEKEAQKRLEARRQKELDTIRASGREPDLFDDIFAGTSDN